MLWWMNSCIMVAVRSLSCIKLVVCNRQSSFGFKAEATTWFEEGIVNIIVKMQEVCGTEKKMVLAEG